MTILRFFTVFAVIVLGLTACNKQANPEAVTRMFWEAVIKNDLETMKQLATAESVQSLEALHNTDQDLKSIEVGKATIDGKIARVATTLHGQTEDGQQTTFSTTTVLVKHGEIWEVEGEETVNTLMAQALESMVENLGKNIGDLGKQLSDALSKGVQNFSQEMNKSLPEINKQLQRLQESDKFKELGSQLGKAVTDGLKQFTDEMEKGLEELAKELEKATEEPPAAPTEQKI